MNHVEETSTVSRKQIEANRRNAHNSTGPKTDEGKARVRQNAVKHGMTAHTAVLPDEDPEVRDGLRESLYAEDNPVGAEEFQLVDRKAGVLWQLRRPERIETGILTIHHRNAQLQNRRRLLERTNTDAIAAALSDYEVAALREKAEEVLPPRSTKPTKIPRPSTRRKQLHWPAWERMSLLRSSSTPVPRWNWPASRPCRNWKTWLLRGTARSQPSGRPFSWMPLAPRRSTTCHVTKPRCGNTYLKLCKRLEELQAIRLAKGGLINNIAVWGANLSAIAGAACGKAVHFQSAVGNSFG